MNEVINCSPSVISPEHSSVIFGYKVCQTRQARWLYVENIYEKFYRPNCYDIGGTYIDNIADFWFQYKIERVADVFLLHMFIWNRHEGAFTLQLNASNTMEFVDKKKSPVIVLKKSLKEFKFQDTQHELKQNYLTTYSFKEYDVEMLKDRQLYIPVLFHEESDPEIVNIVKFKHDFSYLLKDPVCSDFTIKVEEIEFKVHKAILAESSEVFKAMFKDQMAESQSGYLTLVDSVKDFRPVLEFIYTGAISDMENCNIIGVLQLADRFNVRGLHDLCQYILEQQLNIDNALETLVYADIYNANTLKISALKMIKHNKSIVKSDLFKEIKSAELLREVCEYLVVN